MKKIILLSTIFIIIILGSIIYYLTRPKFGTLEITSNIKTIDVMINNDKKTIKTPYKENLSVGQYTIKVSMNSYSPFEKQIIVEKNKVTPVNILLTSINESDEEEENKLFFENNLLLKHLPVEENSFKINFYQKQSADVFYTITLLPKTAPTNQEAYFKELKTCKENALSWIKSKGVSPEKLNIKWSPSEASNI